jgi:ABC-type molybdate transport system permease subunit
MHHLADHKNLIGFVVILVAVLPPMIFGSPLLYLATKRRRRLAR